MSSDKTLRKDVLLFQVLPVEGTKREGIGSTDDLKDFTSTAHTNQG